MASQTQGIQQLLVAEKRAAEKVSEARKRKNRRLKQAKEEAQVQIFSSFHDNCPKLASLHDLEHCTIS